MSSIGVPKFVIAVNPSLSSSHREANKNVLPPRGAGGGRRPRPCGPNQPIIDADVTMLVLALALDSLVQIRGALVLFLNGGTELRPFSFLDLDVMSVTALFCRSNIGSNSLQAEPKPRNLLLFGGRVCYELHHCFSRVQAV